MKSQDLNQEQKLQIILCGPLPQTEAALLRRGDVEIIRENDNLNLLGGMANGIIDSDMIIVEAPYGHGLYSMTYPVGERKTCPVWMVADPPDEFVWKEPESVKLVDKCCLNGKAAMAHEMNRTKCPSPPKKGTKTRPPVGSKF